LEDLFAANLVFWFLMFFLLYFCSLFKLILAGNNVEQNSKDEEQPVDEIRDNRSLIDNNTAQSLSSEDIEAMRRFDFLLIALE
jgi:Gcd10p family